MKHTLLFFLGIVLVVGAVATASKWFPYQLPFSLLGGFIIGGNIRLAIQEMKELLS